MVQNVWFVACQTDNTLVSSTQRDAAAPAPVTGHAVSSGVYWAPPWRDLVTIRWTVDDLSANSVTNVDGKFQ